MSIVQPDRVPAVDYRLHCTLDVKRQLLIFACYSAP